MPCNLSVIGSGNWGSVVAKIASTNIQNDPNFNKTVKMWVFPEKVDGRSLIDIINTEHENVKYLPNVPLPENLLAVPDLQDCVQNADFLVFVTPHQFLDNICAQIKPFLKDGVQAVSFIKGLFCSAQKIELISQRIKTLLKIPVSVVSGANVANEVAIGQFAEATLGFDRRETSEKTVRVLQRLFSLPSFRITPVDDIAGVEISGALKNVVALAAGFVDGLQLGSNTKAAILRLGMAEMQKFGLEFFDDIHKNTFWQSSGFADLITTCYAGRNRKCAQEFAKTGKSWDQIEKEMLGGQKLQGPSTCQEVYSFLENKKKLSEFPLFVQIYKISFGVEGERADPASVVTCFQENGMEDIVMNWK